jgi:hypothetical protein
MTPQSLPSASLRSAVLPFADPVLTASVYAEGHLDAIVTGALAPYLARFAARFPDSTAYLWTLRYAKSGEHLKIRIHGSDEARDDARNHLQPAVEALLLRLPGSAVVSDRKSRPLATPVDIEDQQAENYPDRSFSWTTYERSQISLGLRPYLDDDEFAARLTRCLGLGFELLVGRFGGDSIAPWSHTAQQGLLLRAIVSGVAGFGLCPADRVSYLFYHRDCLLRGLLKQAGSTGGPIKIEQTLELFRRQVERVGAGLDRIRALTEVGSGPSEPEFRAWSEGCAHLGEHLRDICIDSAHEVDPFARLPLFPSLFKVLHGLANQVGLTPLNEALAHHLLLAATKGPTAAERPVELKPWFANSEPAR